MEEVVGGTRPTGVQLSCFWRGGSRKAPSGTCPRQVRCGILVKGRPAVAHGRILGKSTTASFSTMRHP